MCFKTAPKKSKRGLIGKILSGSLLILSCSQYRVLANELLEAANLGGRGVAFESPFPGEIQTVREVAGIGDFDGDGFDDLAVSFKVAEEGDSDRWAVGIIFGRPGLNGRHELPGGIPRLATFEFRDKYDYPYAYEISHVGDLNADGLDDLMLGYPETTYSLSPIHGRGMTFLIFGSPKLEGKLFLEDIGVTVPGVIFYSSNPEHDGIGRRIATIGDFNNDGKTDLVITAPFSGIEDRNNAGAAFVLFEIKELPNFVDLDQVGKSVPGFVILGDPLYRPIIQKTFGEMLGFGLSPAGDFNGDQVPDFAILAPIISNVAGVPEPARAYVIYGDGSRQAPLAVHRVIPGWGPMRGNTRVVVEGSGFRSDVQVFFGGILASGIQVVSESQIEALTPPYQRTGPVEVKAVRGGEASSIDNAYEYTPDFPEVELEKLGDRGFILTNDSDEKLFGFALDMGDITGDGVAEVVLGSPGTVERDFMKTAWMVSIVIGGPGIPQVMSGIDPSERVTLITTRDVVASSERSWCDVAVVRDVDGDGLADLGIGATQGKGYVVFGREHFPQEVDIDDLVNDGGAVRFDRGFLEQGLSTPYHLIFAPVGDLTGDGIADFAIGFPGAPMGLQDDLTGDPLAGEIIYLKGASRLNWGKVIDLRNPRLEFKRVHGSTPDAFLCRLLDSAGDVNGDGHQDLLAAPRSDRGGLVYLLFGKSWDQMAEDDPVDSAYLARGGGIAITVAEGVERSPDEFHVASAGDENGDGYDDFLLGVEAGGLVHTAYQGVSYLILGGPKLPSELRVVENPVAPDGIVRIFGDLSMIRTGQVGPAGDFNADGYDDLLIAAAGSITRTGPGPASFYVVFGAETLPDRIDLERLGGKGLKIDNSSPNPFMNQVKSSGDVNGDGLDDFAIAEIGGRWDINNPGVFRPGRVFIIYGEAGSTRFRRGDSNADGTVDQSDAVYTLMALFLGGDQPECLDAADADDSGALDITDAVYSLLWEFRGGPEPPPPEPMACGADPTADELGCSTPPLCK